MLHSVVYEPISSIERVIHKAPLWWILSVEDQIALKCGKAERELTSGYASAAL